MAPNVRLDGLLCTTDQRVVQVLQPALDTFAIKTQVCGEVSSAMNAINHRRLDAVIVDWEQGHNPLRVLRATRNSSWNSKSTIFAMVDAGPEMHNALKAGANFLIPKPSDLSGVSRCLRAAYGTILQQRRKVARCPVDIPVVAKFSEIGKVEARIIDLSVGGLALHCERAVDVECQVSLSFLPPAGSTLIHIAGKVVNADREGRAGICFSFVPQDELTLLENWLALQLAKLEQAEIPVCKTDVKIH